jgi:hypothetical protein
MLLFLVMTCSGLKVFIFLIAPSNKLEIALSNNSLYFCSLSSEITLPMKAFKDNNL